MSIYVNDSIVTPTSVTGNTSSVVASVVLTDTISLNIDLDSTKTFYLNDVAYYSDNFYVSNSYAQGFYILENSSRTDIFYGIVSIYTRAGNTDKNCAVYLYGDAQTFRNGGQLNLTFRRLNTSSSQRFLSSSAQLVYGE